MSAGRLDLVVASGKGGTGKTTLAVNLARMLELDGRTVRLLDCDVEEPNAGLFLRREATGSAEVTVPRPEPYPEKCTGCGACSAACTFNALATVGGRVLVFEELCHACGLCMLVCPEDALGVRRSGIGTVSEAGGRGDRLSMAWGELDIGQSLAPELVRRVRDMASAGAVNIVDAPPGTACQVVAAVEGADAAILVTEPTPFGASDLELALALALELGVPSGVVINRSGEGDRLITELAARVGVPVLGRIPFARRYAETCSRGGLLVDEHPEVTEMLAGILERAETLVGTEAPSPVAPAELEVEPGGEPPPAGPPGPGCREVTVISGKGGTGKTTLVGALAHLLDDKVLADNDVDAADLHLLLSPRVREAGDFFGARAAAIDRSACISCGRCLEVCRFGAVRVRPNDPVDAPPLYFVEPHLCEGCGCCGAVCEAGAVSFRERVTGRWFVSDTDSGRMVHARLGIAEESSGKLVTMVRGRAAGEAGARGAGRVVGDGPPGTGCPVIASVTGCDLAVVVTEPTVSGIHDLERVLALAGHFGVPAAVVVNRADLNPDMALEIEEMAGAAGAALLGRIPFDEAVIGALMDGRSVITEGGPAADALREIAARTDSMMMRGLRAEEGRAEI